MKGSGEATKLPKELVALAAVPICMGILLGVGQPLGELVRQDSLLPIGSVPRMGNRTENKSYPEKELTSPAAKTDKFFQ